MFAFYSYIRHLMGRKHVVEEGKCRYESKRVYSSILSLQYKYHIMRICKQPRLESQKEVIKFMRIVRIFTFQYPIVLIGVGLAEVVIEFTDHSILCEDSMDYECEFLWGKIIKTVSSTIAVYYLWIWAVNAEHIIHLHDYNIGPKFWTIKLALMIPELQWILVYFCAQAGIIASLDDYTVIEIAIATNHLLTVSEMIIFAYIQLTVFTPNDYLNCGHFSMRYRATMTNADAIPESLLSATQNESAFQQMAIVLDTGALIKGTNLRNLGDTFYTVPQVIAEVRDKHARSMLGLRLEEIKVTHPTEDDLAYVSDFARVIGELKALSNTDIRVIALACRLEKERNGGIALRPVPEEVTFQESAQQIELQLQESENQVQEEHLSESEEEIEEETKSAPGSNNDSWSDEEGWITPENYNRPSDPRTSVLTLDYAMQNVISQIGLRLITLHGLEIRHVKRFILKCRSCFRFCKDNTKEFCPFCGNHTLYKVAYSINESGQIVYHERPKKHYNLRGTKYPIPKPKGGKKKPDIILREDQLLYMGGRQNKWNWAKKTPYDTDVLETFGMKSGPHNPWKYGHKRRNPNEPLPNKSRKRKRR